MSTATVNGTSKFSMAKLWYTLGNEGSLAVLKEPLGFFCETRGSFDGVGFF